MKEALVPSATSIRGLRLASDQVGLRCDLPSLNLDGTVGKGAIDAQPDRSLCGLRYSTVLDEAVIKRGLGPQPRARHQHTLKIAMQKQQLRGSLVRPWQPRLRHEAFVDAPQAVLGIPAAPWPLARQA